MNELPGDWTYWRWEWGPVEEHWRLLRTQGGAAPEEFYPDGSWRKTSPSAMDAITGMGADGYSSGEYAFEITPAAATELAAQIASRDCLASQPFTVRRCGSINGCGHVP